MRIVAQASLDVKQDHISKITEAKRTGESAFIWTKRSLLFFLAVLEFELRAFALARQVSTT
jgi:hypothetical protein